MSGKIEIEWLNAQKPIVTVEAETLEEALEKLGYVPAKAALYIVHGWRKLYHE